MILPAAAAAAVVVFVKISCKIQKLLSAGAQISERISLIFFYLMKKKPA